jgi:hypothetical protein
METQVIIFYILLLDSLGANIVAWFGQKWYMDHFRPFAKYFPASRGWAAIYLILVLWIGSLVLR